MTKSVWPFCALVFFFFVAFQIFDYRSASAAPFRLAYIWGAASPSEVMWPAYTHVIQNYVKPVRNADTLSLDTSVFTSTQADTMTSTAHANQTKVLLCVFGTNEFVNATDTSTHTNALADVIINYALAHGYDGIDIDWETNIPPSQYSALLAALRSRLDQHTSPLDGSRMMLTTYLGGPSLGAQNLSYLDLINLSCYDNHGWMSSGMGPVVWHDAALYPTGDNAISGGGYSCSGLLASGVSAGIPKSKLGAAVPYYVRQWVGGLDASGNGAYYLGQSLSTGANIGSVVKLSDVASYQGIRDTGAGNPLWYGINNAGNASDTFFSWWDALTVTTAWTFLANNNYGAFTAFSLEYETFANEVSMSTRHPLSQALLNAAGSATATPTPTPTPVPPVSAPTNSVNIVSANSAKCVNVSGYSTADGAQIIQWTCNTEANSVFNFVSVGNNLYEIVNLNSGKCLNVSGYSTSNGAPIVQWSCSSTESNNLWSLAQVGSLYQIVNLNSGKCLNVTGSSTTDGAQIIQWTCTTDSNNLWLFQSAAATSTPTPTPTPTPAPVYVDTVPPTVQITYPTNGSYVTHRTTVSIAASATDNVGVSHVDFYVNGTLKCTDSTAPYTCAWAVPRYTGRQYNISAIAYDTSGNSGQATAVTVISK